MKRHNLILFGHKNCGKSYWGKKLSMSIGLPLIETDTLIEKVFEEQEGYTSSCPTIYSQRGEEGFRCLEKQAIALLKERENSIISLGGGTLCYPEHLASIRDYGQLVYLKVPKHLLYQRFQEKKLPAYCIGKDPEACFHHYYEKRAQLFDTIDAVVLDLSELTEERVLEELKEVFFGQQ